jgi:hypothetical protein
MIIPMAVEKNVMIGEMFLADVEKWSVRRSGVKISS